MSKNIKEYETYNLFCRNISIRKSMKYAGMIWKKKMKILCINLLLRMSPSGYQTCPSKGYS